MTLTSILGHLGHQGGLGGSTSKFDPRRGFFAPNQKFKKLNMFLYVQYTTLNWNWVNILKLVGG